ncbi:MAG TPA: flagellar biosynthesis protein FlhB [Treponemataceae bacterium]|nr:flagellar biosynthesis protein FlhB [Treponemataceae bacterium]HOQ93499.1 flagellar biosynthesis protein FlhB [Treponemataceae bacterium]HPM05677.1 flagellar biosynthesis protein FlhB [Treponemataceae bacterium]
MRSVQERCMDFFLPGKKTRRVFAREAFARQDLQGIDLDYFDLQWFASAEEEGRTEKASEHKLRKAREEGRVAKSQEISAALVMLFPVIALVILAPWYLKKFIEILRFFFDRCTSPEVDLGSFAYMFFRSMITMILPLGIIAMISGVLANIVQNRGFIFSTKPISPKFSKILPKFGEYFKKTLFSGQGAFNVLKSIVKVAFLFTMAFILIKNDLPKLLTLSNVNMWQGISHVAGMVAKLLIIAAVFFLVIAIPDYLVQRHQFMESMKMSKQEVKEEYKNLEGDPFVKGRIKQYIRDLMSQNMSQHVAEADVIITNPTHYAIAIKYDREIMQGPMLTAKGVDSVAHRIKEIAKEHDVEIIENKPLARALYAEVQIGDIIPEAYYQVLAIILGQVYKMRAEKV